MVSLNMPRIEREKMKAKKKRESLAFESILSIYKKTQHNKMRDKKKRNKREKRREKSLSLWTSATIQAGS